MLRKRASVQGNGRLPRGTPQAQPTYSDEVRVSSKRESHVKESLFVGEFVLMQDMMDLALTLRTRNEEKLTMQ
jgi:hypothetical protein